MCTHRCPAVAGCEFAVDEAAHAAPGDVVDDELHQDLQSRFRVM